MRYTETSKLLEDAIRSIAYVKSVYSGDVYDLWNNAEVRYVSACYDLVDVSSNGESMTEYNIRLYVADRLMEGGGNVKEVLDSCEAVFKVFRAWLLRNSGIEEVEVGRLTPFEQKFADNLAGYYGDVTITVLQTISDCV